MRRHPTPPHPSVIRLICCWLLAAARCHDPWTIARNLHEREWGTSLGSSDFSWCRELSTSRVIFWKACVLFGHNIHSSVLFSSPRNLKKFQDFPSHRILWHMHEAFNIDENKNYLHSLSVNHEMNLLILVSLRLDNICQIKTKMLP